MKLNKSQLLNQFKERHDGGLLFASLNSSSFIDILNNSNELYELIKEGLIQKRDCEGTAYELTQKALSVIK